MGVDLKIVELVYVEPILVGLNTVEVNVVDTILCRTYSVCTLFCRSFYALPVA